MAAKVKPNPPGCLCYQTRAAHWSPGATLMGSLRTVSSLLRAIFITLISLGPGPRRIRSRRQCRKNTSRQNRDQNADWLTRLDSYSHIPFMSLHLASPLLPCPFLLSHLILADLFILSKYKSLNDIMFLFTCAVEPLSKTHKRHTCISVCVMCGTE